MNRRLARLLVHSDSWKEAHCMRPDYGSASMGLPQSNRRASDLDEMWAHVILEGSRQAADRQISST